ncbi:MAG: CoA pyrophosphatase [Crocinitomicaceae bacterium]
MEQCTTIYEKIQYALNDLPGDFAHKEMYPIRKSISEINLENEVYRSSAVLALLYREHETTNLILTQRQEYEGKHSGQISFPGGKKEDYDTDFQDTAKRETMEEIGLEKEKIHILGKLTDVFIPVSSFLVHPFIGYYEEYPAFILSEREVKEVITFDINLLQDEQILSERKIHLGGNQYLKNVPVFEINGKIVWGATALILNEIRHLLKKL